MKISTIIWMLLLTSIPVFSQDSLNIHRIGSYLDLWQGAYNVEVSGDYAYVCSGRAGLIILDISDPFNIQHVGRIETYGYVYDMEIVDTLAYIVESGNWFNIFSIADPSQPRLLSRNEYGAWCIIVVDSTAYLGGGGVKVLDVSDPFNVQLIGRSQGYLIGSMYYADGYIYSTGAFLRPVGDCFAIICVDPPESPEITYTRQIGSYFGSGIFAMDSLLFLTRSSSVGIYNTSDKSNPVEIGRMRIEMGYNIAVRDTLMLITGRNAINRTTGLNYIDISDPLHPEILDSTPIDRLHYYMDLDGNSVYLTDFHCSMGILDISNIENPEWKDVYSTNMQCVNRINSWGNYVCINGGEKIWLVDFTSITEPELLSTITLDNDDYLSGVIYENYLYKFYDRYLMDILDISDPGSPECINTIDREYPIFQIIGQAGVSLSGHDFTIVDLAEPENPRVQGQYSYPDSIRINCYAGDFPYLVVGSQLSESPWTGRYLDLFYMGGDDGFEQVCGIELLDDVDEVAISEDMIYVLTIERDCIIIKALTYDREGVHERTDQINLAFDLSIADDVCIEYCDDHLFITAEEFGLRIIDVSDKYHLAEAGYYCTPGNAVSLAILEDGIVIGEESSCGIYDCSKALEIECISALPVMSSMRSYPNPFNSYTTIPYRVPESSHVSVTIFDFSGREVKTLVSKYLESGQYYVNWSGKNNPAGVYFCRIEGEGFGKTVKLALVK